MVVLEQRSKRFPVILYMVLLLNLFSETAYLAMLIAFGNVLLHIKYFSSLKRSDFVILRRISWPFLIMIFIGLLKGLITGNQPYDIFKDLYFFLKAVIYFLFGYISYKRFTMKGIINSFVMIGFLVSVSYLFLMLIYIATGLIDFSSVYHYRKSIPDLPYEPIISIMFLLFLPKNSNSYSSYRSLFVTVQTIAIASLLSRLSILILILIFIMRLKLKLNFSKSVFSLGLVVITLIMSIGVSFVLKDSEIGNSDSINSQFLGKVINSFQEISSSDFSDNQLVRKNWRAYESLQGIKKFSSASSNQKLLGHGFGELTSVGIDIKLGGKIRSDVPIFHNGYIYLLVKLGLVGVLLYILFLINIIRLLLNNRKIATPPDIAVYKRREKYSLILLVFFLFFITMVFFGIFSNAIFNNILILLVILLLSFQSHTYSANSM